MREKHIIKDLLASKAYCSSDELSKRYQVSVRTISNDIRYLNQISRQYGFEILLKRKEGYYLKVLDQKKLDAYLADESCVKPSQDRITTIIVNLLLSPTYTTQDALGTQLQISRSMIKLDMNKVEEQLAGYGLKLNRRAHYGICIEGSMSDRRRMLMDLMDEHDEVERLMDEEIDTQIMKQMEQRLIEQLRVHELSTNYEEMLKLDRFFKVIMILRRHGFTEKEDHTFQKVSPYMDIAQDLKQVLENIADLKLQVSDMQGIQEMLRQKTKPKKVELEYDAQLKHDILAFLKEADKEYQTAFLEDEEFIQSLFAHVSLLVDRLHQSISFDNPLVHEISAKYPEIFNISIKFAKMLEERYRVHATQDEIGFIATHFAAHMEKEYRNKLRRFNRIAIVCSSGGGSAFLIKLKMESLFMDANIQTFSFMEMDDLRFFQPDIIFTIKELKETFDVPIVLIKELLDDEDIQKIKHMFEFCRMEMKISLHDDSFHSLFHECAFWQFEEGSYQEIISFMANELEKQGCATVGYRDFVMKREDVLSTVYHNGIAIPHPIEMCADHNMLGVGIVHHDLQENNRSVRVIFLVNLKKGNLEIHQNISRVLFDLMQDERLVERIRTSSSYEDFMKNISSLEF